MMLKSIFLYNMLNSFPNTEFVINYISVLATVKLQNQDLNVRHSLIDSFHSVEMRFMFTKVSPISINFGQFCVVFFLHITKSLTDGTYPYTIPMLFTRIFIIIL